MQNLPIFLITAIAISATITACLAALRLRQARREFEQQFATWKLQSDANVQQARRERDQLLDALTDAFLLLNSEHRLLFANRAAITMFSGRDLIGRHIDEVFLDHRLSEALTLSLESNGTSAIRVFITRNTPPVGMLEPHGVHAWIIDAARISESPAENPTTRVVIRDVTGEHQIEQIRKDFVANASHELRTPLAIINGYLENLLDDDLLEDPELARRFLNIMRKHTRRIIRIVEDMLVISRLESGEAAALKIKPFRIRTCFADVLERLESMIHAQAVTVVLDMPDDSLKLVGDKFYWTQVIFNLVENALKQNRREGLTVIIGCARDKTQTRIWVSDNGVGIPEEDLTHIFRRFYRVEKHHSREQIEGTGLGLSIVKRAIEAHGGTIEVTSIPNEDTRFTIYIPKAAEEQLMKKLQETSPNTGEPPENIEGKLFD
jgi:two-component system phosphate regulon sensor histidine kinase PhoR